MLLTNYKDERSISKSRSLQPCYNAGITTYITGLRTGWQGENKSSSSFGCLAHAPDPWCHRALIVYQTSKAPNCLSYVPEQLTFPHIPIRQLMLSTKWQKCTSDLLQKSRHGQLLQARMALRSTVPLWSFHIRPSFLFSYTKQVPYGEEFHCTTLIWRINLRRAWGKDQVKTGWYVSNDCHIADAWQD